MKRIFSFLLAVVVLVACHELITDASPPNFAVSGCEADVTNDQGASVPASRARCRILTALESVYSALRNTQWGYYNLSEVPTDEIIVPTRGTDWFDQGRWLEFQRHTWAANSPAGLDDINAVWNDAYAGIAGANDVLHTLWKVRGPERMVIEAEARTLRAFYYYQLMDVFGGVPIYTTPELAPQPRATRAEVFAFVESELLDARRALPESWTAANYARMTKGAADAILASLYLNAAVFTSDAPNATGYNSCASVAVARHPAFHDRSKGGRTACDAAIAAADRILNSGQYWLVTDWHANFAPDTSSPENILVVENLTQPGLGLNFVMRSLHYNQLTPEPWNGFAALAETYNAFDADDRRREIFLVGPQVNLDTGEPTTDRAGNPLVFTVDIVDETQAGEGEGTRILKHPPDPNRAAQDNGNDFAYFRLAEIYLIKAEALHELGGTGEALSLVNTLRARVFEPDKPLSTVDRDVILRERLFELTGEAKRRQDLIRHGRFTLPWSFKQAGAPHLVLMPIPQSQLDTNPMLVQNPGY